MTPFDPVAATSSKIVGSTVTRLFVLDLSGNQVVSMKPDGSDRKVLAENCEHPDGIVVDAEAGHMYWTNMGMNPSKNDGSIERADVDGGNRTTIIPRGKTFTPKQLHLDKENGKLYWCDREGMRVMRANLDGSRIETLVETGDGDADRANPLRWCVGITIDFQRGHIYWTQKGPDNAGLGRIMRANLDLPADETPNRRSDVEVWLDGLPEPIDLEIDPASRMLYWTDRGDPPLGNTVNRLSVDTQPLNKRPPEIVMTHLMEGIGLALDGAGGRMFVTDLGGSIYSARRDGSEKRVLLQAQGNLTGIACAEIHSKEK